MKEFSKPVRQLFDMKLPQNRIAVILFIAQSFFSASTIAAFTLSPIIATDLSGSGTSAGLPQTLTLIGRAAFAYPLGLMMDALGRRFALSFGYSVAIFGALVAIFGISQGSFILFLTGSFMIGMARAAGDQSRYIAAEVFPLAQRAKVIGFIVFAGTVGAICGPLLVTPSAAFAEQLGVAGPAGPFGFAAIAMVFGSFVTFLFLRPEPQELARVVAEQESANDPDSVENLKEGRLLSDIFANPKVQLALLSMILSYFVMGFLMVITPLHMDHHHHGTQAISGVIMAHTLGMFGLSWFTGWLIDRYGRITIVYAGAAILILSCILAPLSLQVPILGLALFMLGLGWNFGFVAGSSLLSDALAAEERARVQGLTEGIVALTAGLASFSVGYVFHFGGYLLVSVIGFVLSLVLAVSAYVLSQNIGRAGAAQRD